MLRCERNSYIIPPEGQEGVALVTLITLIVLFGLLAVAVSTLLNQSSVGAFVEFNNLRALYLAEAGLNDSFWELRYGSKLYGQSSLPLGRIDTREISFHDGSSGHYYVPEPNNEILSTGESDGVKRSVKMAFTSQTLNFAFYTAQPGQISFGKNVKVTGNIFVNGDLTVVTPTNMDTNYVTVYLKVGDEAHYSNGALFPYVTVSSQPAPPVLNTAWYDSLLSEAASQPGGDAVWGSRSVQGTVFINGNLLVGNRASITRSGGPAIVVVTGAIVFSNRVSIADSISFIAGNGIAMLNRVEVGQTTGTSGNICFSRQGIIAIALQCTVNGSVISGGDVSILSNSTVNGLVFAVNRYDQIINGGIVNGVLWVGRLSGDSLKKKSKVIYTPQYLPSGMPPGVTPPGGASGVERVPNSWKEVT